MTRLPREPTPGGGLSVQWGRDVVRWMRENRVIAGTAIRSERTSNGVILSATPQAVRGASATAATDVKPFSVRWYPIDDNGNGEWQIYLPVGCASVSQSTASGTVSSPYIPLNDRAKDRDGQPIPSWYKIDAPADGTDDDYVRMGYGYAHSWTVHILMKPWARMKATACPSAETQAWMWDEAVATIGVLTREGDVQRMVDNFAAEDGMARIAKTWNASGDFAIRYAFASGQESTPSATPKAYLANQHRFLGRLDKIVAEDTDISSWTGDVAIWVRIDHASTEFAMSVGRDFSGSAAESDDDKTVYRIWTMKDLVPTTDTRSGFPSTVFYTSPSSQEEPDGGEG